MSKTALEKTSNLVSVQLDMNDTGGGLQGGGEAIGGFFNFMKSFAISGRHVNTCESNCIGRSISNRKSESIDSGLGTGFPSVSEQLEKLSDQVLILSALLAIFIVVSLAKPYIMHRINQRIKTKKRSK